MRSWSILESACSIGESGEWEEILRGSILIVDIFAREEREYHSFLRARIKKLITNGALI